MKIFLRELENEWKPLKYWPTYIYSRSGLRWRLRNFLISTNRELVKTIGQLRDSPATLMVCVFAVTMAYFVTTHIDRSDVAALLSNTMNVIVALLSVLIAAAIFISTAHQKNRNRTIDEDMLLKAQLIKSKFVFSEVYEKFKDAVEDNDKIMLFKAVPAAGVSNNYDYQQFKVWHKKEIKEIDENKIQPYDRSIIYPYDMVMQMSGMRTYYITEASPLALRLLEDTRDVKSLRLKQDVESLQSAAERYHTAGTHGYYVPTDFAGRHLMRIVIYCLLALMSIALALLLENYNDDLFPHYNFHIIDSSLMLSIILSTLALFLVLRHVFHFIKYLRDSTTYAGTMFDNFYIYEEDNSAKDPESPYAHG